MPHIPWPDVQPPPIRVPKPTKIPNELKELIRGSKQIFEALGNGKQPIKEEQKTISFAFQSVVSTKEISKGEKLTKANIFLRRPGNGDFLVNDYKKLFGKKVKRNIKKNVQIKKKDF